MLPEALPGPVGIPRFDNPAPVPKSLLPSINVQIKNDNGTISCNEFTQSETSVVSFGSTIVAASAYNQHPAAIRVRHGDGNRFVVRADKKLTAFVGFERGICGSPLFRR